MKTFKVREITAAIRKDGYAKTQGQYFIREPANFNVPWFDRKVVAACALGQASLNLNVSAADLEAALRPITSDSETHRSLGGMIIRLNDFTNKNMAEIADTVEAEFKDQLDQVVNIR